MTTAQRNRAIKKMLINKTGNKSIKLKGGTGTAYGWIHINLDIVKPDACRCIPREWQNCRPCKDFRHETSNNVEKLIVDSFKDELRTYMSDDYRDQKNYNCVAVHIGWISAK